MVILWLRLLDWIGSRYRLARKASKYFYKYGAGWRDKVRSGRRYSRVEREVDAAGRTGDRLVLRPEPGWEWTCQNCKSYSFVTDSMMSAIIGAWEAEARKIVARGYNPGRPPTAATAGCTNCCYRPGSPE